jgi:hypothetical protein
MRCGWPLLALPLATKFHGLSLQPYASRHPREQPSVQHRDQSPGPYVERCTRGGRSLKKQLVLDAVPSRVFRNTRAVKYPGAGRQRGHRRSRLRGRYGRLNPLGQTLALDEHQARRTGVL